MEVMVYQRRQVLYVIGALVDADGVSRPVSPVHVVPAGDDKELLQVVESLVSHEPPGAGADNVEKEMLRCAGATSKREFFAEALLAHAAENGDSFIIYPTENVGPHGGYYYIADAAIHARSAEALATGIKTALEQSTIKLS